MEAVLLYRDKYIYRDGAIREMAIRRLAEADSDFKADIKKLRGEQDE